MKTSLGLLHSTPIQQYPAINRQPSNSSENYQAQAQGMSISLTTREGDTITLSQRSASSQYRKESITTGASQRSEQDLTINSMAISVQGDLNQQELDDLSRLVADLSAIATDFFNGNMDTALAGAMDIGGMGSISRLEATFSRTSILANYLTASHPLPAFSQNASASLAQLPFINNLPSDSGAGTKPRLVDLTTAQWRQFVEAISHHQTPPIHPPSPPRASHESMVAKDMLERAEETLAVHPRLTPLLQSVVDLALDMAARQHQPREAATRLAQATSTAFNSIFAHWAL